MDYDNSILESASARQNRCGGQVQGRFVTLRQYDVLVFSILDSRRATHLNNRLWLCYVIVKRWLQISKSVARG